MAALLAALWLCVPARAQLAPAQAAADQLAAQAKAQLSAGQYADDPRPLDDEEGSRPPLKVSDTVWRSARPNKTGLERLYTMGVRTILNLESPPEHLAEQSLIARVELERALQGLPDWHIRSLNVAMSGIGAPDFDKVDRALKVLTDPADAPVLVHCMHGEDRTGVVVAAYRVEVQNWPIDKAVAEAKSLHCCHLILIGDDALRDYLRRYDAHRRRPSPRARS